MASYSPPASSKRTYPASYAGVGTTEATITTTTTTTTSNGQKKKKSYDRAYESTTALPLKDALTSSSQRSSYRSDAAPSAPPSIVQIPPQPTQSTAGSVVDLPSVVRGSAYSATAAAAAAAAAASATGRGPSPALPMRPALTQSPGPMLKSGGSSAPNLVASSTSIVATTTASTQELRVARGRAEAAVSRLAALQYQYSKQLQQVYGSTTGTGTGTAPPLPTDAATAALQAELRTQTGYALAELREARQAVASVALAAESHRIRRWLVGGFLATFIPLVRRFWRRRRSAVARAGGSASASSIRSTRATAGSNQTEYAFLRSQSVVDRILQSVLGPHRSSSSSSSSSLSSDATSALRGSRYKPGTGATGLRPALLSALRSRLATFAFFVLAVLYVFTNEVTLRVARTVSRRLKRLSTKMERGEEPLDSGDLEQLEGWRWRVLTWGRK